MDIKLDDVVENLPAETSIDCQRVHGSCDALNRAFSTEHVVTVHTDGYAQQ